METNKRNYILYLHINKIDGKKYYGITSEKNPNRRWRNGKGYQNNEYFTNAIEKHGWDNFEHIILFENLTESEAYALEKQHIAKYNTKNREFGYNLTDGGEGTNGYHHTEESKRKISEKTKGENNPMYGKGYLISGENHPMYGKYHTEESKQKMSESKKGKKLSEESKQKISKANKGKNCGENNPMYGKTGEKNPMYGKHHTEESKQKMSELKKGKYCGKNHPGAKSVICITTRKIFLTCKEGAEYYNTHNQNISKCCKGKYKSAGTHNGQKLVWRYLNHKHNFTYRIKGTMES